MAAYLDDRATKLGDRHTDEDDGRVLDFAKAFLGDRQVEQIGKKELGQLEKALTEIPHRQGVPKRANGSMHKRYLYAQDKGWDRLTRDAFSEEELIRLFSLPLFTGASSRLQMWKPGPFLVQSHIYWAFQLLFFCGMRPSEIAKLTVEDFRQEKDIWFADLRGAPDEKAKTAGRRRLKTQAAYRRVPQPPLPKLNCFSAPPPDGSAPRFMTADYQARKSTRSSKWPFEARTLVNGAWPKV